MDVPTPSESDNSSSPGEKRQKPSRSNAEIVAELEHRARSIFWYFNQRDWNALNNMPGIAPNFRASSVGVEGDLTYHDLMRFQRLYVDKQPEYHVHIIDVSATVDDVKGSAVVFVLVEVSGLYDNVRGENAFVLRFCRQGEEWLWERHTSVKGTMRVGIMDPYRAEAG